VWRLAPRSHRERTVAHDRLSSGCRGPGTAAQWPTSRDEWPSISVVVAPTTRPRPRRCLLTPVPLPVPNLDVAGGSTRARRMRLLPSPSAMSRPVAKDSARRAVRARNAGVLQKRLAIVSSFPTPTRTRRQMTALYLASGMDGPTVGGVGVPHPRPGPTPSASQLVARAPGGPVHVMIATTAEPCRGLQRGLLEARCPSLVRVGDSPPSTQSAGDDVDACVGRCATGLETLPPVSRVWHHADAGGPGRISAIQRGLRAGAALVALAPELFTAFRYGLAGTARI